MILGVETEAEIDGVLPFPAATGQGVRIAVIDSGVFPDHPHIGGRIAGGAAFQSGVAVDSGWVDQLGHGTAVTAAIREKAPEAELHAVKVFHDALRTSAATLIRAVDWCIAAKMDLANLSLGSTNPAHAELFAEAAERASRAGLVLVAAREANSEPCYPGCLPSVINVGLDWECPRHQVHAAAAGGDPVIYASGYPRSAPGVPRARNLYGISFAVANVTGVLARGLSAHAPEGRDRLAWAKDLLASA